MDVTNRTRKSNPSSEAGERDLRPTVIPTPRRDGMFSGWGVRF